ncbi:hypothetical protein [Acidovorax sp. LjRoot194]|uniref:hypothetical protein n=1 Tax=Acidovorax sp. LjRoot194 TaxID=3342280 RepID=UPI003ED0F6A1
MKVIGRQLIAQAPLSLTAKRRLSLWISQLKELRPASSAELSATFPESELGEGDEIVFRFPQSGVRVETLTSVSLGIVCIEHIYPEEVILR